MTDTTDDAQVAHALRAYAKREWGFGSHVPHLMDEAANALERLSAENVEIRTKLDTAVQMLADWCLAVAENGTGWDDWDEHYKDAAYRDGPLRVIINEAMRKAKE